MEVLSCIHFQNIHPLDSCEGIRTLLEPWAIIVYSLPQKNHELTLPTRFSSRENLTENVKIFSKHDLVNFQVHPYVL